MEKGRHKGVHALQFHLSEVQKQASVGVRCQDSDYFGGSGRRSDNILFLDPGGDYKKNPPRTNSLGSPLMTWVPFLYFYNSRKKFKKSK